MKVFPPGKHCTTYRYIKSTFNDANEYVYTYVYRNIIQKVQYSQKCLICVYSSKKHNKQMKPINQYKERDSFGIKKGEKNMKNQTSYFRSSQYSQYSFD